MAHDTIQICLTYAINMVHETDLNLLNISNKY